MFNILLNNKQLINFFPKLIKYKNKKDYNRGFMECSKMIKLIKNLVYLIEFLLIKNKIL